MKYNRNYRLFIQRYQDFGDDIVITPPLSIEFEITRNSFSSANVASFRIYNLAPETRGSIRKDAYDYGNIREINFEAGYGDRLALGFAGNISSAWSTREGVNMITQIECFDGGYAYVNATTNLQFPAGTSKTTMIQAVMKNIQGVKPGAIGNFQGSISRGNSVSGNPMDLIQQISGATPFIDNGRIHCIQDNEAIDYPTALISHKSGLIGTPTRENMLVNLEMMFEPSLQVSQIVRLDSTTSEHFNGDYTVMSIRHRGIISDTVSGQATTSVSLLPATNFGVVRVGS